MLPTTPMCKAAVLNAVLLCFWAPRYSRNHTTYLKKAHEIRKYPCALPKAVGGFWLVSLGGDVECKSLVHTS
jgi:hypothetical protein